MVSIKGKPVSAATEKGSMKIFKRPTNNIISQRYKNFNRFNPNLFDEIKNQLDIKSVTEYYGVQLDKNNSAICPFHKEKTPSFRVFPDSNNFHCFGCGEHGDVINFTMKYFTLTSFEAAKKLNADFRLNLPMSEKITKAEYEKSLHEKEQREKESKSIADFDKWIKTAFRRVCSYYRYLKFWGEQIIIYNNKYFEKYQSEIENIWYVETLLDYMIEIVMNDFDKQIKFYNSYGEWVEYIERKYQLDTLTENRQNKEIEFL